MEGDGRDEGANPGHHEWERHWNETQGPVNLSELCRELGISRQTGHKWVRCRYRDAGHDLLG